MPNEKYQAPSPLQSIAAGAAAGGVESLVTVRRTTYMLLTGVLTLLSNSTQLNI